MKLIAGDIGGTKTTLAFYAAGDRLHEPACEATYSSGAFPSLEGMVRTFMEEYRITDIEYAAFGVAGPVMGDLVEVTNLPWVIDKGRLASGIGCSDVHLLNDLEAVGHSIPFLGPADLSVINRGVPSPHGPMAVIAPGTGLGETYLTWNGSRHIPHASEGGHADFGPTNAREVELLQYLLEKYDHVSYELVCSGMGIPNIYAFLRDRGHYPEPSWLAEKVKVASDPTIAIMGAALDGNASCDLCRAVLDLFVSILGAEAGNLALKTLPTAGLYVGGGIPPRIAPALGDGRFMESFLRKGRLSRVLRDIPVSVILNPRAGLIGAAGAGFERVLA
ncbi:MAG TPA: glucokinase [Deltaproteobacteria bacterium]|jgi:glucokinase|nr:glucokinase [Deltaproteobacteria bacterium]HOI07132.1 glucokinase [Deltaproteobacteria bacterium]